MDGARHLVAMNHEITGGGSDRVGSVIRSSLAPAVVDCGARWERAVRCVEAQVPRHRRLSDCRVQDDRAGRGRNPAPAPDRKGPICVGGKRRSPVRATRIASVNDAAGGNSVEALLLRLNCLRVGSQNGEKDRESGKERTQNLSPTPGTTRSPTIFVHIDLD